MKDVVQVVGGLHNYSLDGRTQTYFQIQQKHTQDVTLHCQST